MEITALSNTLLAAAVPTTPPVDPSALATERFNAIMNAPDAAALQPTAVQSALQTVYAPPTTDGATLGSQILSGLQSSASQMSQQWQNLSGTLDRIAQRPAIGDMLQFQSNLVQMELQYDLVSKAVSRSTQNVDTLVRMS